MFCIRSPSVVDLGTTEFVILERPADLCAHGPAVAEVLDELKDGVVSYILITEQFSASLNSRRGIAGVHTATYGNRETYREARTGG